jgi:phage regulator Rha-like protein
MLDVPHKVLVNTIDNFLSKRKNNGLAVPLKFPQIFKEGTFKNRMGRTYRMYEMNEQAYMKLCMQLKGYEKAEVVQDAIIEAFSLMKTALLNQQNASWLEARKSGKQVRRLETNTIKDFVEYATKQGSKSASKYYMSITKMTNKALELLNKSKYGDPLRDLLTIQQLGFIQMLEIRATQSIQVGMEENLPYKYIYKYAKSEVNKLADSLCFKAIIPKNLT